MRKMQKGVVLVFLGARPPGDNRARSVLSLAANNGVGYGYHGNAHSYRRPARSTSPTLAAIWATLNGLGMKYMPSRSISRRSCSSA